MSRKTHSPYSLFAYLKDIHPYIITLAVSIVFCAIILIAIQVPRDAIILLLAMFAIMFCVAVAWGYLRRARFFKDLAEISDTQYSIGHLDGLIADATSLDASIAKEALEHLSDLAEGEITKLALMHEDNSRYIDLWIHEVKTPIAACKLMLGNIHGESADALRSELERIEGLVEQALYASKAGTLARDYIIAEARLFDLVGEACKSNMCLLTAKGVSVNLDIPKDLVVLTDKSWLRFILSQIIVNSAKYDATKISFSISSNERHGSAGQILLEIGDDGCGIPAEDVPRVFDRGFTGSIGRTTGTATGMGLYLAARMCSEMAMGISIASEEGLGTRVILAFPHDDTQRGLYKNLTLS